MVLYWGRGVAPGSKFGSINAVAPGGLGTGSIGELTQQMTVNGAEVMNNSWGFGAPGYSSNAALFDRLVRDPDPASDTPKNLAVVFSAGNSRSKETKHRFTQGVQKRYRGRKFAQLSA